MTQQSTTPQTAEQALHTIANCIPSLVAPDADVRVNLHLTDAETFDGIRAEHSYPAITHGGGNEFCSHTYRAARFEINGVAVVMFQNNVSTGDSVVVDVMA